MTEIISEKSILTIPDVFFPFKNDSFVFPREKYDPTAVFYTKEGGDETKEVSIEDEKNVVLMIERFSNEASGKWSTSESWFRRSELVMIVLDAILESVKSGGNKIQIKQSA
jgi:hypothetical protein